MKKLLLKQSFAFALGMLLVFPSFYFITSSLLNEFGISFFWRLIEPIFAIHANKQFGFNENMLIAFGPVLAIAVNLPQILLTNFHADQTYLYISLRFKLRSQSWLIVAAGLFSFGSVVLYQLAENCRR